MNQTGKEAGDDVGLVFHRIKTFMRSPVVQKSAVFDLQTSFSGNSNDLAESNRLK